ncbi:glycerol dehydrogenase [Metarhizium acridum CQMa 102]|uniref:Glycerol dehydrogenase n=1 Tax=Metarhizium acridum (strain CQMa 102) TaxID=655827 RepID=E9DXA4_METAQ|nr:glycerol dehydrogenase [Metarhizium acridum CQMa 102]EFY91662.1 glycerol dehydrogenase [Metarhizium acridum CQMa 102]
MAPPSSFKLNTGASIPAVGLGTWQANPGEVGKAVEHALNWNTHQTDVAAGLAQTLEDLQTDYLDLYLVHWPVRLVPNETSDLLPVNPDGTRSVDRSWDQQDTWRQMEEVYRSGKARAIGVSNWSVPYLEHLKKTWTVTPAVNQVELHPFNPQHKLKEWCDSHNILLEAYCPLGSTGAPLLEDEQIASIAKKNGISPATVLISYQVNRGCVVLPKSVTANRIEQNLKVVELSKEDMKVLDGMAASGKQKRVNTPAWGHDLGFEDWYGPVPN